jgi:hypothetical protein
MYTLVNTSSSISGYTYNAYQSLLQFTASIASANVADEYRAYISDTTCSIWDGSIQVYSSQSIDKPAYLNQNDGYISNLSENEFIILD